MNYENAFAGMAEKQAIASTGGMKGGLLLAGCVTMLALPSAVLAFSTTFKTSDSQTDPLDSQSVKGSAETLSKAIAMRSFIKDQAFPFTPAGTPVHLDRAVTVAVRVDQAAAQAIIVRGRVPTQRGVQQPDELRIASTAFNLGVSRGYQNFAQNLVPQPANRPMAALPDLKRFNLQPGKAEKDESRFSPRITIDERKAVGRAPRTFAGDEDAVDLGGAYRVTKNLDVTAGVRYSQERERLVPLTDGRQDNQAVYVGTQFRF